MEWTNFYRKFDEINEGKLSEDTKHYKSLIDCDDLASDSRNIIQFYSISDRLPKKSNIRTMKISEAGKKSNIKPWRPSILFSKESIVLHITIPGEIEEKIKTRTIEYNEKGLRVQHFIIVVGLT